MGAAIVVDKDLRIPMRDGVELAADVYRPSDGRPAPTLVTRTPYGTEFVHYISSGNFPLPLKLAGFDASPVRAVLRSLS